MYQCPFDGQYFDLSKWNDGQPRKFKHGLDRFRRLRVGSKSYCHYRNIAWICKNIHGRIDEYEKFIRQAAESKEPDVTALLDFAKLNEDGIYGYKEEEKAQLLKQEAEAILKKLRTTNDKILCDLNSEARSEEEVQDEGQNLDEQPSHMIHEVECVEENNSQASLRGHIEESGTSNLSSRLSTETLDDAEEILRGNGVRNPSSSDATLDNSRDTSAKSTLAHNSANIVEPDQPNSPVFNQPIVEQTMGVDLKDHRPYQIDTSVLRQEHPKNSIQTSNTSNEKKPSCDNESVTVQPEQSHQPPVSPAKSRVDTSNSNSRWESYTIEPDCCWCSFM